METALVNCLIAWLGIISIAWLNAWKSNNGRFDWFIWVGDNSNAVVFAAGTTLLLSIISFTVPDVADVIKNITGLDVPINGTRSAWFILGISVYEISRKTKRKRK